MFRAIRWLALFAALCLACTPAAAQTQVIGGGAGVTVGSSLPATCAVGDLYFKTAATVGLYECTSVNTWELNNRSATAGSVTFTNILTGSNSTATMTVDAGGVITFTSTGQINASHYKGITTVTATEFGYIAGLSSAVQTQLGLKAPLADPAFTGAAITIGGGASATDIRFLEPSGGGASYVGFKAPALAANIVFTLPATDSTGAQCLSSNGSLVLGWSTCSGGAGLTSLNALTAGTQTFATPGTAGTAPAWTSLTSTHTLDIPLASAAGVTAGLISKTQYDVFNTKAGLASNTFTGSQTVRAGTTASGTAPIYFQAGAAMTTPQAHAFEWDGTNLFVTQASGPTRKTLAYLESPVFTGAVTLPTPFTLGATSVTTTGVQFNYWNTLTGVSGNGTTGILTTITSPVANDALAYNGSNWVNSVSGLPSRADNDGTVAIATTDRNSVVNFSNASPSAISIAQAGVTAGNGFIGGFQTILCNGGAGLGTLTPATSTINGVATLTLSTYDCARVFVPIEADTNYRAVVSRAVPTRTAGTTQFLREDYTFATPAGSGTINSGATNFIPKYVAATTIDDSLASDDGTTLLYTGAGGIASLPASVAGSLELKQGTAPSAGTTSVKIYAPASVTSYVRVLGGAAATGIYRGGNSAGVVTDSQAELSGVVLTSGSNATTPGKSDVVQTSMYCLDAGTTDTYACNLSPAVTAYVTGTRYLFKANTVNTGAASINFNTVGALTIKKMDGAITTDLDNNDIRAGQWVSCFYDGTNCQMESQVGNGLVAVGTAGTAAVNAGTALTHARSDHEHNTFLRLAWYFPGTPAAGVQTAVGVFPEGLAGIAITDMRITVDTTSASTSSVNIQRCTASCTGTTPTFAAIYSTDLSLAANTRTVAKAAAPNQNVTSLDGGDQFKVQLVTVGASLADVTVTMTYKVKNTN